MNIIETSWYFKYRPKSIDEYIFESEDQYQHVHNWLKNEKIPGNLLLYGPPGTGKTALAEILIRNIIKSEYDILKVKERSVSVIDELYKWLIKRPVKSKSKIVYIEEFDRLSAAALRQLKDGILENYQQHVSFIATTNYVSKIDKALLTRFNFKFELKGLNTEGYYKRLKYILDQEGITYDDNKLKQFVIENSQIGLRDLINNLEINIIDGTLDLDNIKVRSSLLEEEICNITLEIIQAVYEETDVMEKRKMVLIPLKSKIADQYRKLLEIISFNNMIKYEDILSFLDSKLQFLPMKEVISQYIETIDLKKYPYITYTAFLYQLLKCLIEMYP